MESSPSIEFSSLTAEFIFLWLSLFPRVNYFGWENLYLKVFLDYDASEGLSWASSDSSFLVWASKVGSTFELLAYGVLMTSEHWTSDGLIAYELPGF